MKNVREGENHNSGTSGVDNPWEPSGFLCFRCGWPELTAGWFDDVECIGEHRACANPDCEHWEDV